MKNLIAGVALAASVLGSAACAANPPEAPVVAVQAPIDPDSCKARHDVTPCTLTNQEAFIEILKMSQTNREIHCWVQPTTWQEMMLPPKSTGECR